MAAFTTPLRPRSAMPPTNCSQLAESFFHALGHSDDVGVAFGVHPDGDGHAHVFRRAAPRALVPHAVHEHVGVFAFQRPRAPRVDVAYTLLSLSERVCEVCLDAPIHCQAFGCVVLGWLSSVSTGWPVARVREGRVRRVRSR